MDLERRTKFLLQSLLAGSMTREDIWSFGHKFIQTGLFPSLHYQVQKSSRSVVDLCAVRYILSIFTVQCTESLGVEHLSQVVGSQRVDGQDALVRKPPLAAGNEDRQQLAVCGDVAAGIVVDLTVWHKNIDGGWAGDKKRERSHFSISPPHASKTDLRADFFLGCVVVLVTGKNRV